MKKIAIIGASGHGRVVADIAALCGYDEIVFLDDNTELTVSGRWPIVGKPEDAASLGCDVVIGIGNTNARKRLQEMCMAQGLHMPVLVHPAAVVAEGVQLGEGTVVVAGAVINPCAVIGKGCIVNTCASVDHDSRLGDYVHVSVGAHVAGTVVVGDCTWIAIGAVISNNLEVAANCMIGAGAVVVKSIHEAGIYEGVPAKKMGDRV